MKRGVGYPSLFEMELLEVGWTERRFDMNRFRTYLLNTTGCVILVVVLILISVMPKALAGPGPDTFTAIDFPGAIATTAFGINPRGDIVGEYFDGNFVHGYLLSGGSYTLLNVPGASFAYPYGINDSEQIVGSYTLGPFTIHGFLLDHGSYTTLDVPGSVLSQMFGINNAGQIVGHDIDAAEQAGRASGCSGARSLSRPGARRAGGRRSEASGAQCA